MSAKTTKRRQKRLNTDDDLETTDKSPKKNEDSSKESIKDEEIPLKDTETKVDSTEVTNGHKIEENGENGQRHEEKNGVLEESTEKTPEETSKNDADEDTEPLIVVDSDTDSDLRLKIEKTPDKETTEPEKSPVLTGMTTRSHKNSPKPENGMDTKVTNEVRVNITRLEKEIIEEEIPKKDEKEEEQQEDEEVHEIEDEEEEEPKQEERVEIEEKDVTNASVFVNLGNDTTRNVDITTTSTLEDTISNSFIEVNKDVSYGQALRSLSGRRTLRRDSPYVTRFGKSTLEKDTADGSRKSYIPHISSVKRKNLGDLPEDTKRFKTEDSPGIFSYISSPINSFRNKISRSEIPSSTPKLTSYKFAQGSNIIDDMSKIDLEEKAEPKKWCTIM